MILMPENFADRMFKAIIEKKNPSCVGLDPRLDQIPEHLRRKCEELYGSTPEAVAETLVRFNSAIIDAVADIVPVVKPQVAFYEQYGPAGVKAFQDTVRYAHKKGLVVIGDVKRNDIGSTASAYGDGYLGAVDMGSCSRVFFDTDAVTVNPYFGSDGVNPFLKHCKDGRKKGAFALCRTSNESAGEFQDRLVYLGNEEWNMIMDRLAKGDGADPVETLGELPAMKDWDLRTKVVPNYVVMGMLIDKWGSDPLLLGELKYSALGAVVGATYPAEAKVLRKVMPNTPILVPGYGAQGATADDVMPNFDEDGVGAVVNASRSVIFAYKKSEEYGADSFEVATAIAAAAMRTDLRKALTRAGKGEW